jgi:hypothetical protein
LIHRFVEGAYGERERSEARAHAQKLWDKYHRILPVTSPAAANSATSAAAASSPVATLAPPQASHSPRQQHTDGSDNSSSSATAAAPSPASSTAMLPPPAVIPAAATAAVSPIVTAESNLYLRAEELAELTRDSLTMLQAHLGPLVHALVEEVRKNLLQSMQELLRQNAPRIKAQQQAAAAVAAAAPAAATSFPQQLSKSSLPVPLPPPSPPQASLPSHAAASSTVVTAATAGSSSAASPSSSAALSFGPMVHSGSMSSLADRPAFSAARATSLSTVSGGGHATVTVPPLALPSRQPASSTTNSTAPATAPPVSTLSVGVSSSSLSSGGSNSASVGVVSSTSLSSADMEWLSTRLQREKRSLLLVLDAQVQEWLDHSADVSDALLRRIDLTCSGKISNKLFVERFPAAINEVVGPHFFAKHLVVPPPPAPSLLEPDDA